MSGELLPPPDLAPPIPHDATPEQCIALWVDLMNACEDLVLHKLIAGRLIDRADAAALLRANRTSLDLGYLKGWTGRLGLAADLREAWNEALPNEQPPEMLEPSLGMRGAAAKPDGPRKPSRCSPGPARAVDALPRSEPCPDGWRGSG